MKSRVVTLNRWSCTYAHSIRTMEPLGSIRWAGPDAAMMWTR